MRHLRLVIASVLTIATLGIALWTTRGRALPLYAARTGLNCNSCHFDPNGGGPRNEFGFTFARNRHMLSPEDTSSRWHDLSVVNRVGDNVPIYFGLNQRFMMLASNTKTVDGLDSFGFFNMENAIHLTFQPHSMLTLVYTRDGFNTGSQTRDAFGMITGGPWSSYLKAGQFRTPFGMRMDDHTVATRNSFVDVYGLAGFLPYDPRIPDRGIEIGAENGPVYGRTAFTNGGGGSATPFGLAHAEAKTLKLGYHNAWYQGTVSLYDDYRGDIGALRRATRWGYGGSVRSGPVVVLGELAAGTDEANAGQKKNLLAGYAEVNYPPARWVNFRVRYDYLCLDRSADDLVHDQNTFSRYSLEGEIVPVPFAELRWTLRRIDAKSATTDDITQGYVQFHFSY